MQKLPTTMRAAAIDRFGSAKVLSLHRLPLPLPGPAEVLIALDTVGVGGWDLDMREGWSPDGKTRFPLVLGTDGAGIVAAVGGRIRRFKKGDRVYAFSMPNPKGGFYAEYAAVPANNVARVPRGLGLKEAGANAATALTAIQGVDDALDLKRGETVFIHGAGGGVGTLAVQFARLRGARVLASATGTDGRALALRLGADAVVDGRRADILAATRRFAPLGLDAILAFAGGPELTRAIDGLKRGGRLAHPAGVEPAPRKRKGVRLMVYDAVPGIAEFERLRRAIEANRFTVPIANSFLLGQAGKAHQRVAKGHVLGKVVLRIR